jgi:hypothetical protein
MMNKKAVSEAVGAMLMIALTVTAGGIVYVYASGTMGSLEGSKVQQPYLEQITLDYYTWRCGSSCESGALTLMLRNSGSKQLSLADFFIAGNLDKNVTSACTSTINVNTACSVSISYGTLSLEAGYSYNIKVATSDGAIFSFPCIAGNVATG